MVPTLMIVDDHAGFRRVARTMFSRGGFVIAGEAATGEDALSAVGDLHPDVVLLDIQLPDTDGFEVAQRIAQLPGEAVVVLTSTRSRASFVDRLAHCPARGFIAKEDLSVASLNAMLNLA